MGVGRAGGRGWGGGGGRGEAEGGVAARGEARDHVVKSVNPSAQQPRPKAKGVPRTEGWLVGCLTSQRQASVSQGRICSDNFTCCHTEIEVADPTFHLTQSQYTGTGQTSPSADPITPGAWQGRRWSANFEVTGMTRPQQNPGASGIRTRDLPLSRRTNYH